MNDEQRGDVPPQDNAAEQAVLGAMVLSKDAINEVATILRADDFYRPQHEQLFEIVMDMFARGEPVDQITLHAETVRLGLAGKLGGAPYLHTLSAAVPSAARASYYATIVRDKAILRRLATTGQRLIQWSYAEDDDALAIADRAEQEVLAAVPQRGSADYRLMGEGLEETLDAIESMANGDVTERIPTGFYDLDDLLAGGWQGGQMIVVAGRPAMGKSTLATDFMRAVSLRHPMTSCIFSLEMTRQEITMRLLSAESKVPLANLRHGRLSDGEWARIALEMGRMQAAPLFIDDSPNLTMTEIRAKARRLKQRHDLRLVVIDYMQLMSSGKKVENRQVEVSEFSRQIKLLAKELMVPVVALSQLNRGPEQRTSKRPMLSDLRESGSIEQDADVVILLHRDDQYEKESSRPGEADLIVAKHRNGATRDIAVAAQLHYSRFADLATV